MVKPKRNTPRHRWALDGWPWPSILARFDARALTAAVPFAVFARSMAARVEARSVLIAAWGAERAEAVTQGQIVWICREAVVMKERDGER